MQPNLITIKICGPTRSGKTSLIQSMIENSNLKDVVFHVWDNEEGEIPTESTPKEYDFSNLKTVVHVDVVTTEHPSFQS